jgi:hypothetical protein
MAGMPGGAGDFFVPATASFLRALAFMRVYFVNQI